VIARLRPQLAAVTGVTLFQTVQDLRGGGRQKQFDLLHLESDNTADLKSGRPGWRPDDCQRCLTWTPTRRKRRRDHGDGGQGESAARLGVSSRDVDNALYNAFGQCQVATIYGELNQYRCGWRRCIGSQRRSGHLCAYENAAAASTAAS
jgi:multidrug efflux pump